MKMTPRILQRFQYCGKSLLRCRRGLISDRNVYCQASDLRYICSAGQASYAYVFWEAFARLHAELLFAAHKEAS